MKPQIAQEVEPNSAALPFAAQMLCAVYLIEINSPRRTHPARQWCLYTNKIGANNSA